MRSGTRALWGYRAGAWASRLVPGWALDPVSGVLGRTVAALMPARREVVARNLARALEGADPGAVRRASSAAFCSYIHYWIESFQLPHLGPEQVVRHVTPEGFEHLEAAVAAGRGTILALPHLGSWDYAGAWMAACGHPMTVVMEPLEPPELFELLAGIRRSLGMKVVRLGPEAVAEVMASLRRNQVVGLLADRDLTGTGVEVEFFGEVTTLPAGPAALALRTGAALLPSAT
ncbi:MAG TPA: phosphatidylinositol mannoside acyltransferase, partial [Acidimicrobiales bacterium]|nr:phosphatidylinositol mannoside acyltransferase [Acidimicrobiales bacterium]